MAEKMVLVRYLLFFWLAVFCLIGYAADKEIYIGGESSISDLRDILVQWDKFSTVFRQYSKTDQNLKTCNFDNFDIEYIEAINQYKPEKVKNLFPQFAWVLEDGKSVKALRTYAPCDQRFVGRSINWFFYVDDNLPVVLGVAVGAAMH